MPPLNLVSAHYPSKNRFGDVLELPKIYKLWSNPCKVRANCHLLPKLGVVLEPCKEMTTRGRNGNTTKRFYSRSSCHVIVISLGSSGSSLNLGRGWRFDISFQTRFVKRRRRRRGRRRRGRRRRRRHLSP